jgi:DNA repair photolyase
MGRANLAHAAVSITTLDRKLARSMEPRAATPARRLDAVRQLTEAGVPTIVMVAPIVPGLNDHEIEAALEAARDAGAQDAGYVLLRLPLEIKDLFREWLEADHPDRARRVMSLVRQTRGGRDYDPEWRKRQVGEGPVADLISARFAKAKKRLGMTGRAPPHDLSLFRVPPRPGDQLGLFG